MSLLADAATIELMSRTPWPEDVRLFQQYEVEQILMYDFASCLAVKTFLNMLHLKFQTELRQNASFMSPNGQIPFLQVGPLLVAEFDAIVTVAAAKGHSLGKDLTNDQKTEMKAYTSLVTRTLGNALKYLHWYDKENLNAITKPRYGSVYRWPLNRILPMTKRWQMIGQLNAVGWTNKNVDEVYDEVDRCLRALSNKLGSQRFFFGTVPCELDGIVFGYLYTILTTELPSTRLVDLLATYQNLNQFSLHVHDTYFKDHARGDQS